jgi:hypothetical protein
MIVRQREIWHRMKRRQCDLSIRDWSEASEWREGPYLPAGGGITNEHTCNNSRTYKYSPKSDVSY